MKKNKKRFYPYHFLFGLGELHTICDVAILVETDDLPAAGVWVLLMCEKYIYLSITNENGVAFFPSVADDGYIIYLAKSGANQAEFRDSEFEENMFVYEQGEKTVYNGMFANTPPQFYVDRLDGGNAYS